MHLDDKTLDFKHYITGGDWVSRTGVHLPCRWEGMQIAVRGQVDAGIWIVLMTPVCHVPPSKPFSGTFAYCLCTGPLGLQQICHRDLKRHLQVSVPSLARLQSLWEMLEQVWGHRQVSLLREQEPSHASQGHPTPARPQPAHVRHMTVDALAKTSRSWYRLAGAPSNLQTHGKWIVIAFSFQGQVWVLDSKGR